MWNATLCKLDKHVKKIRFVHVTGIVHDRLGGETAIDAAVDIFYRRVLADAYINHFFKDADVEKQAARQKTFLTMQKAFLTMVTGGPNTYTGKDMRECHKHLVHDMGLNDSHFNHIVCHLRSTLAELGVAPELIKAVADIAESTRADALDR